jgi:hypothetical protein
MRWQPFEQAACSNVSSNEDLMLMLTPSFSNHRNTFILPSLAAVNASSARLSSYTYIPFLSYCSLMSYFVPIV